MSRTYRRRGGRHDYDWVLRSPAGSTVRWPLRVSTRIPAGRCAVPRRAGTGAFSIIAFALKIRSSFVAG